ncbi:MAG: xanthine dehydrogenase family protein subunit M [Abitibacteriaceae bacterium]|nr:xanthine dehydrogenase family protein subunit M [Abditibacteriaceae bacterium]
MKNFEYASARDTRQAVSFLGTDWNAARIMGGGTDLLDEMKERLVEPDRIVHLPMAALDYIKSTPRAIVIGATTTIATLETHPVIKQHLPGLAQAATSLATPQIRNMGTIGGNLCQRPRCWYYRNAEYPCLKKGGSTCYAKDGANKYNAILGGGPSYIVHPSDIAPMALALNASVRIAGPKGERLVPLDSFFTLPNKNITRENILEPNEIVTEIIVPTLPVGSRSVYLKVKERDTQDFALASAGVAVTLKNGVVQVARIALGGVAPIPWRAPEAEAIIKGHKLTPQLAQTAAEAALKNAKPLNDNAYKVPLAITTLRRALLAAMA